MSVNDIVSGTWFFLTYLVTNVGRKYMRSIVAQNFFNIIVQKPNWYEFLEPKWAISISQSPK